MFDIHTQSRTAASPAQTGSKPRGTSEIDAYWRACNYLCAGMIYLRDNPLLKEPLARALQEPAARTLGLRSRPDIYWVHLNRVIRKYDLDMIYISGPGHGAPAVISPTAIWKGRIPKSTRRRARTKRACCKLFRAVFVSRPARESLHA